MTLGVNKKEEIITEPTEISTLSGIPVKQLDFGVDFGAVLTSKNKNKKKNNSNV